ncbi:response regulator, partial [Bdellovibrionota bacterium FG-2]
LFSSVAPCFLIGTVEYSTGEPLNQISTDFSIISLVVDDMKSMRSMIAKALREIGFTDIAEAEGGANAWTLLTQASPPFGLILSDWNMPISTGIDLLKSVRADSRFKKTPFIMVTAENEACKVIEAVKSGATNFLVKPLTKEWLRTKLEDVHKQTMKE